MAAVIYCPSCRQNLPVQAVPPAGTIVQCYRCGATFAIPQAPVRQQPTAAPFPPPAPFSPTAAPLGHNPFATGYSPPAPPSAGWPGGMQQPSLKLPASPASGGVGLSAPVLWGIVGGAGALLLLVVGFAVSATWTPKKPAPSVPPAAPTVASSPAAPSSTPLTSAPASALPVSPVANSAPLSTLAPATSGAAALAYQFPPGAAYRYLVSLEADASGDKLKMTGEVTYTGAPLEPSQFATLVKDLDPAERARVSVAQSCLIDYSGTITPSDGKAGKSTRGRVLLTKQGEPLHTTGDVTLVLLSGSFATLALEPLPEKEETTWNTSSELPLHLGPVSEGGSAPRSSKRSRPGASSLPAPSANALATTIPVLENATYTLESRTGDLATIRKHLELNSLEATNGQKTLEMQGDGSFVFDCRRGLITTSQMTGRYKLTRAGKTQEIPLTITCRLDDQANPPAMAAANVTSTSDNLPSAATTSPPASGTPGSATSAAPASTARANKAEEVRTVWRYSDAPYIFSDQPTNAGVFRKQGAGDLWLEERSGASTQDYQEVARTPEYVELKRPNGGFFIRLYKDRSTYRFGNQAEFQPMFPGKWE